MTLQPDILKSQKPNKKPRSSCKVSFKSVRHLLFYALQPAPFLLLIYSFYQSQPNSETKPFAYDILIQASSTTPEKPLSDDDKTKIFRQVDKYLTSGAHEHMKSLTSHIITNSDYQSIRLFKSGYKNFQLAVEPGSPVLLIEADKLRYVSGSFQVYGHGISSSLPVLKGVFTDKKEPFKMIHSNFLALNALQKMRIKQAVHLMHLLSDSNLDVVEIHFKKFRGFLTILKNSETEVYFGIPPFSGKIKKLHSILQELAKNGRYASRVELDFEDKAFVKEKLY